MSGHTDRCFTEVVMEIDAAVGVDGIGECSHDERVDFVAHAARIWMNALGEPCHGFSNYWETLEAYADAVVANTIISGPRTYTPDTTTLKDLARRAVGMLEE